MFARLKTWYERPSGMGEVLRVSMPLIVAQSSFMIMMYTDRMFLSWHSLTEMPAALFSGMLSFLLICFPLGVVSYINAFVAQYYGAGRPRRIGTAIWQAVFLCLVFTPLVLLSNPLAPSLFEGHPAHVAVYEVTYFQIMNWGSGAILLSAALSSFYTGRGQTRVVMIVDFGAAALNIALDYAWIFGEWGFPAWGIAGAAWATVVSLWAKTIVYFVLFLRPATRTEYDTLLGCRFDRVLMRRLVAYGLPSGLLLFIDMAGFTALLYFIGGLGETAMAATTLAFNVNSLAFMPVFGISLAAMTLVGQRLGENRPELAERATWTAFTLGGMYMLFFSAVYVLLPDLLLWPYAVQASPVDFLELRELTIVLLRFVAIYCLFDAMYLVIGGALKGAGDTRWILYTTGTISSLAVLITWLGISRGEWGLFECWIAITVWICILGSIYLARFMGGKWRNMRVIEPLVDEAPIIASPTLEPAECS